MLIEAIPNISEGRDFKKIQAIAQAFASGGLKLLHLDSGPSANRTVLSLAGDAEAMVKGLLCGYETALDLIDMRQHQGVHPRSGAVDVCPLIPLSRGAKKTCLVLTRQLGQSLAQKFGLPVYLYGQSATSPERRALSFHRRGGYEGLSHKIKSAQWKPDFGTPCFNPKAGITVLGLRKPMIAYNLNLKNADLALARRIAAKLRFEGPLALDRFGNPRYDRYSRPIRLKQGLPFVQAIGWQLNQPKVVQVSTNLLNYRKSGLFEVFERVQQLASNEGALVCGSELVGLVPLEALIGHGKIDVKDRVALAIKTLGLDELSPFNPNQRILEWTLTPR